MSGLRLIGCVTAFEDGRSIGPIDLSLPNGQMLALLGASGSGKTTTLRMIAGLNPINDGTLLFGDRDVTDLSVRQRKVGMVFQNFGLFPHLNVADNITFGLRMGGGSKDKNNEKLKWIVEKTHLQGLENRFSTTLSGGQKQRVALARTLVMDPEILLLDEPLSNLDANLREEVALFIKELQQDLSLTTVFVTHDQNEAMMLADQVVVMENGSALQQGTAKDVFEKPRHRSVAEFMGATNFLPATISGRETVRCPLGELTCREASAYAMGEAVTVMIRPENIVMSGTQTGSLCGEVVSARYHGGYVVYIVRIAEEMIAVQHQSAEHFPVGAHVWLQFDTHFLWVIPEKPIRF
ncbi:ABC transporter ATP-binding protein [Sneathiella sp.]|jgi:ABC-type Fe3+/spermidine/putrescine transport system ATPase subunit|uniref:ABC transporter ATP-binding protein n=1 Tax=Sneathiella sp. TaxID=1964365 RepID=UPI0039E39A14